MPVVSIDGVVSDDPRISVFDRGFLFGDSVYEVTRTVGGLPLFWEEHAARLWRSAELIRLSLDITPATLRAELDATLAAAGLGERYIRLVITRGVGGLGMEFADLRACRVIIVAPLPPPVDRYTLRTVSTGRSDEGGVSPAAKSGNRLPAVLALAEARRQGADEALLVDPLGRVLEGASSTFFCVRDGTVLTPPLDVGILPGITRGKVMALGVPVVERPLTLEDLGAADEAFITSSVRGVVPVEAIDGRRFRAPGPLTARIAHAYAARLEEESPLV